MMYLPITRDHLLYSIQNPSMSVGYHTNITSRADYNLSNESKEPAPTIGVLLPNNGKG
jgi:hypothetical protein